MAYCSNCGTNLEEGATYCPNCGTKIENVETIISETVVEPAPAPAPAEPVPAPVDPTPLAAEPVPAPAPAEPTPVPAAAVPPVPPVPGAVPPTPGAVPPPMPGAPGTYPPPGMYPPPRRTSWMAIVSFVLSFMLYAAPIGIVFGILDLCIKKNHKHGLSIAGIIIGTVSTIFAALIVITAWMTIDWFMF